MIALAPLEPAGLAHAQRVVTEQHYLRTPVPGIARPEGLAVLLNSAVVGYLLLSRTQATRCGEWYGSVDDVQTGRCAVTRWEVLCLARVWLSPMVQAGGSWHELAPGYRDRKGIWRSTLASDALRLLPSAAGRTYLVRRPPVFPDQPYDIRWLLSYCDTRLHKGTIYAAAGWELYRTNEDGIQTWRTPAEPLTPTDRAVVLAMSAANQRGRQLRNQRADPAKQLAFGGFL